MRLRHLLPIYLLVYFFAAFVWRTFMVWKKTGVNPVVFKSSDSAHDFIGRVFKLLFAMVVTVVLVHAFFQSIYHYTMPIDWLEQPWIRISGIALLLLSLAWTVLAQSQMGDSWRIGIDTDHTTRLVQTGVFSISRNPIFLGMMVTLLGLFFVIPNMITLFTFVLGVLLINVQVRLEEEYLTRTHAGDYELYRQQVRRWL